MTDRKHSDDKTISEIQALRLRLKELEKAESKREKVEKALIETEQRLYSIIEGSPIPAFMIGKDHRIIYWNKALEELSRIKAREVIGTRQQWRAFYNTKRPCMADLLVNHKIEDVPKWYKGKHIRSNLLDEAYEAMDFFPNWAKKESGFVLRRRLFAMRQENWLGLLKLWKILPNVKARNQNCCRPMKGWNTESSCEPRNWPKLMRLYLRNLWSVTGRSRH